MRGLWLLAGLLVAVTLAEAGDESPAARDGPLEGRRLFAEAAARVAAGRDDLATVRDVVADLADVQIDRPGGHHEGHLLIRFLAPSRFRWEQRGRRSDPPTIKVLDGNRMWIVDPRSGRWRGLHGTPDGAGAVRQLQRDRDRFANLARFLTLGGLAGAGVTFDSDGVVAWAPPHHLAGRWLKVRRRAPDGERMAFLLAFETAANGERHATWPGAVLVPGDPATGVPTEHYRLDDWRPLPGGPLPRRVQGYTQEAASGRFRRTLLAHPTRVDVNRDLAATWFLPPSTARPAGSPIEAR